MTEDKPIIFKFNGFEYLSYKDYQKLQAENKGYRKLLHNMLCDFSKEISELKVGLNKHRKVKP